MATYSGNRNLGDLAEATLTKWCAEVGITTNPAQKDRDGWDFHLTFPRLEHGTANLLADQLLPPLTCYVQVKGTDSSSKSIPIKLSNWEKAVKIPMPSFILILCFNGQNDCQQAYLLHVGEQLISKAMRRLREVSMKNTSKHLNQQTMGVKGSEGQQLSAPYSQSFLEKALAYVGNDVAEYAIWKSEFHKSVGYDEQRGNATFNFQLPGGYETIEELLIDMSVGLAPNIDVESAEFRDVRFGIENPQPDKIFARGRLEVSSETDGISQVVFKNLDTKAELILPMNTFLPSGLSQELLDSLSTLKIRYTLPYLELVIKVSKQEQRFNISMYHPRPQLTDRWRLQDLLHWSNYILFIENARGKKQSVEVRIYTSEQTDMPLVRNLSDLGPPLEIELVNLAHSIRALWDMAKALDAQNDIRVEIGRIVGLHETLKLISDCVNERQLNHLIRLSFSTGDPLKAEATMLPVVFKIVSHHQTLRIGVAIFFRTNRREEVENAKETKYTLLSFNRKLVHKDAFESGKSSTDDEVANKVIESCDDSLQMLEPEIISFKIA